MASLDHSLTVPVNTEPVASQLPAFFDPFVVVTDVPYKKVGPHALLAPVAYPKTLALAPSSSSSSASPPTKAPVVIRYHGGGMVTGSGLMTVYYQQWLLELIARHGAVMVSPNVRLLPESTPAEQLEDTEDLWKWLHDGGLAGVLAQNIKDANVVPDLDRILVVGESAGGYNVVHQALDHPDQIRAAVAMYPMLDVTDRHYTLPIDAETNPKPGYSNSQGVSFEKYEALVAAARRQREKEEAGEAPGDGGDSSTTPSAVWADASMTRMWLVPTFFHHGLYSTFFTGDSTPEERRLLPAKRIEDGAALPGGGLLLWHGGSDNWVPTVGSVRFRDTVDKTEGVRGGGVKLVIHEGGIHGFDIVPSQMVLDKMAPLEPYVKAWLA
jgi:acetyl esterase/lipase